MPLSKEQMKLYRQANKDKIKAKADAWRTENREKVLDSRRKSHTKNAASEKISQAEKWQKNKDKYNEVKKLWIENNPEKYAKKRQRTKARKQYGPYWEAQVTKLELMQCLKQKTNPQTA